MTEEKEFESAFSKGRDTGSPIFENGNEMPVPKDNPGKNGGGSRKVIVLVAGLILCTLLAVGTFAYQTDSLDSLYCPISVAEDWDAGAVFMLFHCNTF